MKYLIMALALNLAIVGCIEVTGDTKSVGSEINVDRNSSNVVDNSNVSVICENNTDTNCYTSGRKGYIDEDGELNDVANEPNGEFDASDDAATCSAKGYFYCSVNRVCVNTRADSGSCGK